MTIELLVNAIS